MNKNKLIKIGILTIALLLVGYGLYKFLDRPEKTIIVKYKEVPPVIRRFPKSNVKIYYRGYRVGHVSKMALSDDQKYIVFHLGIHYKNLKIPKNIKIYLNSEDLYGSRHFSLEDPENPSSELLSDGDMVYGTGAYERIDKYLVKDMAEGKLGRVISNLVVITDFVDKGINSNSGEFNKLLKNVEASRKDIGLFINDLREVINDPQIKHIIRSSSRSVDNINELLETEELRSTITKAPETIGKTVKSLETLTENTPKISVGLIEANQNLSEANNNLHRVNKNIYNTNSLLCTTNCNLGTINCKVPVIPPSLLTNADKVLKTVDCLSNELIEILSKKFLVFRLMFGNPGSSLKKCKQCETQCLKCKKF